VIERVGSVTMFYSDLVLPVCGAANFLCGVMTFILFKYCRELYFFELIISGNNMSGVLMIYIIVALLNYVLHFSYIIFYMCFFVDLVKMLALKVLHPRILPFMQMELNVTPFNFWNFDNQHYLMAYVITVILNFVICCFCNAV
jgi:hypothetical protein